MTLCVKLSNPLERTKRTHSAALKRCEIFLRNLNPSHTTEEELKSYFSQFGEIESIHIPSKRKSNSGKYENNDENHIKNACAFITYTTREGA